MGHAVLITGGAGFIGSHVVAEWAKQHPKDRCVILDAITYAAQPKAIEPFLKEGPNRVLVKGDILDYDLVLSILRAHQIDTVIHLAAESHVDQSIQEPDRFMQTNILGTHHLLKACAQYWLKEAPNPDRYRFLHVSTDEVYGSLGLEDPAFTETTPYAPNSPYAASKASSDHLVRAYHHTYQLPTLITHCSNNFGPWQHEEKLIPKMIRALTQGSPLTLYGHGQQRRDWLYVSDHARALCALHQQGTVGQIYNIGGHQEWTNQALVEQLCDWFDEIVLEDDRLAQQFTQAAFVQSGKSSKETIVFVDDRPGHDQRYAINTERLQKTIPWQPTPFEQALKSTLHWYLYRWAHLPLPEMKKVVQSEGVTA